MKLFLQGVRRSSRPKPCHWLAILSRPLCLKFTLAPFIVAPKFLSPLCFSILFVPFANANPDAYYAKAKARFNAMGFECESLHLSSDPRSTVLSAEACFVGGGNTFLLLKRLQELDCISAMKEA